MNLQFKHYNFGRRFDPKLSRSPPEADKTTLLGGLCASGAFKSFAIRLADKSRPDQ